MKMTREQYRKASARWATRYALRTGRLTRGPCEMASVECSGPIQAHHDDYSKPLEVRWFCRHHHGAVDGHKMRRFGAANGMAKKYASARSRTENLTVKSRLLCQLSYGCEDKPQQDRNLQKSSAPANAVTACDTAN